MPMQMRSSDALIDKALGNIKPEIRALKGYAAPPQGRVIAKLNQNENPFDIPQDWKKEILGRMETLAWGRYPDNQPARLRSKLADRHGVAPEQIILGHGSNQLLYTLCTALLGRNDRVLTAPPTFSLVELASRLFQVNSVQIQKNPDLTINRDPFLAECSQAKLVFLCSPDNPTGLSVDLAFLLEVLKTTDGLVLWDEAYAEFCDVSAVSQIQNYPNLIVSRTFSKAFGLAGLRVGYLIVHPAIAVELNKANIPYNLDLFSVLVVERLLDEKEWMLDLVKTIINEREKLFQSMAAISGVTTYPSDANFITFQIPEAKSVLKKLQDQGVLVRDMTAYPMLESCLRVTVGTHEENKTFLEKLSLIAA